MYEHEMHENSNENILHDTKLGQQTSTQKETEHKIPQKIPAR
jgi:hypothetical protein